MRKPVRQAVLCVFRFRSFWYPAAGGKTYETRSLEPLRVMLECDHFVEPGEWRRRYIKKEWPCGRCTELFPRIVIEATRKREAARHAAGRCGSACLQCFAAQL